MDFSHYTVTDFITNDSFIRYCRQSHADDQLFWEKWILEHPEKLSMVQEARELYFAVSGQLPPHEVNRRLEAFKVELLEKQHAPVAIPPAPPKTALLKKVMWPVAAAAAVLLGIVYFLPGDTNKSNVVEVAAGKVYSTGAERKSFTLADGSTVTLYPNSRLELPAGYNVAERRLQLEGQAFFNVAQMAGKPFSVTASNLQTTALGTSFLVRAYKDASELKVALVSGKVKVQKDEEQYILQPGEQFIQHKLSAKIQKANFDIGMVNDAEAGVLSFKDAGFNEVIEKLEAFYGVTITVTYPEEQFKHFTGTFNNASLEHVLEVIAFINQMDIRQDSGRVYLQQQ